MSERQRPMGLDRLDGEIAADITDPRQLEQGVDQKAFVTAQVRHYHLQKKIRLAGVPRYPAANRWL